MDKDVGGTHRSELEDMAGCSTNLCQTCEEGGQSYISDNDRQASHEQSARLQLLEQSIVQLNRQAGWQLQPRQMGLQLLLILC